MTYTFGLHWVRRMVVVWDFGDGSALACEYPYGHHRHRYVCGQQGCIEAGGPYCDEGN